jgi:hypothetical protein
MTKHHHIDEGALDLGPPLSDGHRAAICSLVESGALDMAVGAIERRIVARWVVTAGCEPEILLTLKKKQEALRELEQDIRRLYKTIGPNYVRS